MEATLPSHLYLKLNSTMRLWALLVLCVAAVQAESTAYLPEIMLGRCLERPPTGWLGDCPLIVPGVLAVLESRLDSRIFPENFLFYLEWVDDSEASKDETYDKGWLWLSEAKDRPTDIFTPESTPGGSLMRDLVFCGRGRDDADCTADSSQAMSSFWKMVYADFASKLQGRVSIAVDKENEKEILEHILWRTAIDNLNATNIESIDLYTATGDSCSEPLVRALKDATHNKPVTCFSSVDLAVTIACHKESDSTECKLLQTCSSAQSGKRDHHGWWFFLWILVFAGIFCLAYDSSRRICQTGYEVIAETADLDHMPLKQ